MQFALNINGERINIKDAQKEKDYYCPCCGCVCGCNFESEVDTE